MIIVEKTIDDLTLEKFTFITLDHKLYLDTYSIRKRESKRHTYKLIKLYNRLSTRDSSMTEDEVPFTLGIRAEALQMYKDTLKCLKWSER